MTHKEIITKAFGLWLAAGCKTYGKTPQELKAMVGTYAELLSDLTDSELLEACRWCATHCPDFPSASDVRNASESLRLEKREQLRAAGGASSKAHEDCPWCDGSGWEPIDWAADYPYRDHLGGGVTRCRCLQPGFNLPPVEPRKQIEAGEFKAIFEDAVKGRKM